MALDLKYGRVTLEDSDIGEDEPVVVFRAKDGQAVRLLEQYRKLCADAGSPQAHLDRIEQNISVFLAWQASEGTQVPGTSPFSQGQ